MTVRTRRASSTPPLPLPDAPAPASAGEGSSSLRRIDSPRNSILKLARGLQSKRERRERRLIVAEGEDLLLAALAAGLKPHAIVFDESRVGLDDPLIRATAGVPARYLASNKLVGEASSLAAAPRVLAIIPQPEERHFRTVAFPPSLGLFLAGVADPGNVGSLVRTAAAFGCDWVAIGPGSADPFHAKAVRGAMGATFAVPLLEGVRSEDLATREGFAIVAAASSGGTPPWEVDLTVPLVLALGAEREGLDPVAETLRETGRVLWVTIPQAEGSDSLNVGAAGAALLAEIARQRSREGGT